MKYGYTSKTFFAACLLIMTGCGQIQIDNTIDAEPALNPDICGVTVPVNIAPLHFCVIDAVNHSQTAAIFKSSHLQYKVRGNSKGICISMQKWRKLLNDSKDASISIQVLLREKGKWNAFRSFVINVSKDPIDKYLAYRLIEPGYEVWNEMGIYQRNLENFSQSPIITNRKTGFNCMNCHSFCMQDPSKMVFHMRASHSGTYLIQDGEIQKLNTKTDKTISNFVYPSWHPSGKYIAFSLNNINQLFHSSSHNRVEVYDTDSDVVVYDIEHQKAIIDSRLTDTESFETFPTFSPDGKTMYYCTADTVSMPQRYDELKYRLCSVEFNPQEGKFGKIDTLYAGGKSVSFPRISPDGRFLIATMSDYGNFSIWHQDADLYIFDLNRGGSPIAMDNLNSNSVESYHSWSSNSRWLVVSSRRSDGLYTRPYIAHIDAEGVASKPFVLPQDDPEFYHDFMKSYNIPEFITDKVGISGSRIRKSALSEDAVQVGSEINP